MKELNTYSTQLIRELIIPKLTKEVNTSKRYAALRQVFFSLVLARWFKERFRKVTRNQSTETRENLIKLIDSGDLTNLISKEPWSKTIYFNEYKKSFEKGEYNLKEQVSTPTGQVIRSYVSGGHDLTGSSAESPFILNKFNSKRGSFHLPEILQRMGGFFRRIWRREKGERDQTQRKGVKWISIGSDGEMREYTELDEFKHRLQSILQNFQSAAKEVDDYYSVNVWGLMGKMIEETKGKSKAEDYLGLLRSGEDEINSIMNKITSISKLYEMALGLQKFVGEMIVFLGKLEGGYEAKLVNKEGKPEGEIVKIERHKTVTAFNTALTSINNFLEKVGRDHPEFHRLFGSTPVTPEDWKKEFYNLLKNFKEEFPKIGGYSKDKVLKKIYKESLADMFLKVFEEEKDHIATLQDIVVFKQKIIPKVNEMINELKDRRWNPTEMEYGQAFVWDLLGKWKGLSIGINQKHDQHNDPKDARPPDEKSAKTGKELAEKFKPILFDWPDLNSLGDRDAFVFLEAMLRGNFGPSVVSEEFGRKFPDLDISQFTGEGLIRLLYSTGALKYVKGSEVKIDSTSSSLTSSEEGYIKDIQNLIEQNLITAKKEKFTDLPRFFASDKLLREGERITKEIVLIKAANKTFIVLYNSYHNNELRGIVSKEFAFIQSSIVSEPPVLVEISDRLSMLKGILNLLPFLSDVPRSTPDDRLKFIVNQREEKAREDEIGELFKEIKYFSLTGGEEDIKTLSMLINIVKNLIEEKEESPMDRETMMKKSLVASLEEVKNTLERKVRPYLKKGLDEITKISQSTTFYDRHKYISLQQPLSEEIAKALKLLEQNKIEGTQLIEKKYKFLLELDKLVKATIQQLSGATLTVNANAVLSWLQEADKVIGEIEEVVTMSIKEAANSPLIDKLGGIDFTLFNTFYQPMGNFRNLNLSLPTLSSSALERFDLDKELAALRNMVKAGMVPSGVRVKEYLAAVFQKGKMAEKQDDLLLCLAEIYRLQEEEVLETSLELRESLVIVDTGRFVLLPNNQKAGLN